MTDGKVKNIVVQACRVVLGLTFVFSGFVKTVDPWGTAVKIGEYMNVYGAAGVGEGLRMALAIVFCAAESGLGLTMLFGVKIRVVSVCAMVVMGFFTVLTFLSATWMPVADCGCFGDAVRLSPWVSFGKNVVLLALAVVVWLDARRKKYPVFPVRAREWGLTAAFAFVALGLGVYCYLHLPLIDFLPFKKGVDLHGALYGDVANGDSEDGMILRGFAVFDSEGDATAEITGSPGRVYILCAVKLDDIKPGCAERFAIVAERAAAEGAKAVVITSSPISAGETAAFGSAPPLPVYNVDGTTMITMLRAATGMVVLDGGVIAEKKNCRDIR